MTTVTFDHGSLLGPMIESPEDDLETFSYGGLFGPIVGVELGGADIPLSVTTALTLSGAIALSLGHNYPFSMSTDVDFGDDVYVSEAIPGVEVSIADDLLYTDGRTEVVIKTRGAGSYQALTGTYEKGAVSEQTLAANKTMVTARELQQSRGFLQVRDVKFRLSAADTDFTPDAGDMLTDLQDSQRRYEILAVDTQVLGTHFLCWCRSV